MYCSPNVELPVFADLVAGAPARKAVDLASIPFSVETVPSRLNSSTIAEAHCACFWGLFQPVPGGCQFADRPADARFWGRLQPVLGGCQFAGQPADACFWVRFQPTFFGSLERRS